jgi:hypothetical protein
MARGVLSRRVETRRHVSKIFALVFLVGASCDPSSRTLSGDDCKARKLTHVDDCSGKDESFQECHFYFRALGSPDQSWCKSMPRIATPEPANLPVCDFSKPSSWSRVSCSSYNITGAGGCYACTVDEPESSRTYVYAYSTDCLRGVEQVTCNFDPHEASKQLGEVRL